MSGLSGILPRAQSRGSARLRRSLRTGMIVALLVLVALVALVLMTVHLGPGGLPARTHAASTEHGVCDTAVPPDQAYASHGA